MRRDWLFWRMGSWIICPNAQMLEAHQGTTGTTGTCAPWAACVQSTTSTQPYRGVLVVLHAVCLWALFQYAISWAFLNVATWVVACARIESFRDGDGGDTLVAERMISAPLAPRRARRNRPWPASASAATWTHRYQRRAGPAIRMLCRRFGASLGEARRPAQSKRKPVCRGSPFASIDPMIHVP
jgi:hypothetical protein